MNAPQRIQQTRRKGWKKPEGAVCVGRGRRGMKWGNPFTFGLSGEMETAEEAVRLFREDVMRRPDFIDQIKKELRGKTLCCWCPVGSTCHGDVLLEIANS